jgi:hypothetical protein
MSCILLLDDGRALHRSNLGYSVMLELVSREVSDAHANLGVWLADMAERTSPFCEFDLRGLTVEHRAEFWAAAGRALESAYRRHGREESLWPKNSYGAECLAHLMHLHRSIVSGEPPSALNDLNDVIEFDGKMEDLEHLWG